MDWVKRSNEYTFTDGKSGFSINFAGMKFERSDINALARVGYISLSPHCHICSFLADHLCR